MRRLWFAASTLLVAACSTLTGSTAPDVAPSLIDSGLGAYRFTANAAPAAAQAWVNQGLVLAYGFDHAEAARTFRHAARIAPDCAMCAWGVAYVLGPNINRPMREKLDDARRFAQRAVALSKDASERDRLLIAAIAARYGDADAKASSDVLQSPPQYLCVPAAPAKGGAPQAHALDIAYARHMRVAYERFPDDADVAALYAESLMMLTPWRWYDKKTGKPAASAADAIAVLREGLKKSPDHPGLLHFLIHATEQGPEAAQTEPAADRLVSNAPDVAHLVHMPSHIYVKTGRYADAVRVNQAALEADVRLAGRAKARGLESLGNWDFHHLHFLWFAASMDGQSKVAIDAARRLAAKPTFAMRVYSGGFAEFAGALPYVALLQFQRWNEMLAEPAPSGGYAFQRSMWHYARGVSYARTQRPSEAERELMALESRVSGSGDALDAARGSMKTAVASLRGELAFARGDTARAFDLMRRAVALEDEQSGEVAAWGSLTRFNLGSALLAAGRSAEAQEVFRADMNAWPNNGRALHGLAESLLQQGKADEATRVRAQARQAWTRADVSEPSLRL
jgi:tetratricopeptide (TPR) repeat protein